MVGKVEAEFIELAIWRQESYGVGCPKNRGWLLLAVAMANRTLNR